MAPAENPDQAAQELLQLATERFGNLSKAEAKLLRAAAKGEFAYCGSSDKEDDPSNDPSKADEWGPERQVRAELIRWLCIHAEAAARADPKGLQLVGARIIGPLDLAFATVAFPVGLFQCRVADQIILLRAHLPTLNLGGSWTRGIAADGVKVEGDVLLGERFGAEGEVRLLGAQIGGDLGCDRGTFRNPPQKDTAAGGKALNADGIGVRGHVFLRDGFTAVGEVRLLGAQIGGQLSCGGGTFKNPPRKELAGSGTALSADRANVKGGVVLRDGFTAEGEVRLLGAQIGGDLTCNGGTFKNPPQEELPEKSGKALSADGVDVKGSVFLRGGFTAEGEVRLLGAQIGGTLDCSGGRLENPPQKDVVESGKALNADGVDVKGSVFLREGFTAEGEVRLPGAQIGGDLDCSGGRFSELMVEGANIARHLLVALIQHAAKGKMDLTNASADALFDDEGSWPAAGNLRLDGFAYGRITVGPTDAETRLKWLALQPEFKPQPYRQLAKVLREAGHPTGARRVLYEMEKLRRRHQAGIWRERVYNEKLARRSRVTGWARYGLAHAWGWLLKAAIGYGFRLQRTLYCLAGLTLIGATFFGLGYLGGAMAPTEREAYACFEKQGWPPRHYLQFNPFVYSLENSVPVLKLGQDTAWAPDPGPREQEYPGAVNFAPFKWLGRWSGKYLPAWHTAPPLLRFFRWGQIILGWMLATLFVAGVTGVVRRE